jgi:hypothetical protein
MSEPNRKDSGIDADKLVNRLLDLVQEQQSELAKLRDQIAFLPLGSQQTRGEASRNDEMIRVAPIAKETPKQLEESEPNQETRVPLTFGQSIRKNAVFLAVALVIATITAISAVKPSPAEVTKLRSQLHKAQESIKSEAADRDQIIISSNLELTKLQRKLSDTEKALTANEKALTEEQQALAQTLQQQTQGSPVVTKQPPSAAATPVDPLEREQQSVIQLYTELSHTREELERNKNAYLENAKELAFNRLALYNVQLAANGNSKEAGIKQLSASNKTWKEFLDPDARSMLDVPVPAVSKYQVNAPPNTADIEELNNIEAIYIDTLKQCEAELRSCQGKILSTQQLIVATQLKVKDEQVRLIDRQSNNPGLEMKRKSPSNSDAGPQNSDQPQDTQSPNA